MIITAGFFSVKISYLTQVYIEHWQTLAAWLNHSN